MNLVFILFYSILSFISFCFTFLIIDLKVAPIYTIHYTLYILWILSYLSYSLCTFPGTEFIEEYARG